jgi:hypothetical protein
MIVIFGLEQSMNGTKHFKIPNRYINGKSLFNGIDVLM